MKWFIPILFLSGALYAAQPLITPPANFGLGENLRTTPSEIDQGETPDSNNMVNTVTGAVEKRQGSRFYIPQAFSTNPIVSLYEAAGSTVDAIVHKVIFATS